MSFRFRNFPVYKDIKKYIRNAYRISAQFPQEERFCLSDQLRRAATSIALNIAEGSDRGSDKEFIRFIKMAIGSLNETIAILDISLDNGFIKKKNYVIMFKQAENIVKQLSGLCKSLISSK
jgi:four helix bundle protein